jgi:Interleukin-like EMT inducer
MIAIQHFNTTDNTTSVAASLASYLQAVASGTFLVGISAFDPATSLFPILDPLSALGVSLNDVQFHGSLAFVAQKGASGKTIFKKTINDNDTASMLNVRLAGEK